MNTNTTQILDQVNQKLSSTPLIYFSREVERSLGLEKVLSNYHICCVEDSYIVDELIKSGVDVFCLEKAIGSVEEKSTSFLLNNPATIEWLNKVTNGKQFYAMTFLPTSSIKFKIAKLGGQLLNIEYDLHQKFENKISQTNVFEANNIAIPKNIIGEIQNLNYEQISKDLGQNVVVQSEKAHTGGGTYFISNNDQFKEVQQILSGNNVRVSEKIKGISMTINICINEDQYYISSPQYQITGLKELTNGEGSTVGNDFAYGKYLLQQKPELDQTIFEELVKISNVMVQNNYKGIFGVDFVVKDNAVYIIEINARQTANIPFQSKLELIADKQPPLLLLHIAAFLGIDLKTLFPQPTYEHNAGLEGAQIFLRAKEDNVQIKTELKSGVYKLQSDNSAIDKANFSEQEIKEHTIFLDEEKDMPLIFQIDGYSVGDLTDGGFVLNIQKQGVRNKLEELARMQFENQIVTDEGVSPWIMKALRAVEEIILH